jgi:hypothetical protein
MSTVSSSHWSTLDKFRTSTDAMFVKEVLPDVSLLAQYDQVIAAGREALESRGLDLSQPEQVYVVSSVIAWMSNIMAGLTIARCQDPHVLAHLRESLMWPAYVVREFTLDQPLPTPKEDTDESAE